MRMNSREPSPSRRKRGPFPSRAPITERTTDSAPLAVPLVSSAATCASNTWFTRFSGIYSLPPSCLSSLGSSEGSFLPAHARCNCSQPSLRSLGRTAHFDLGQHVIHHARRIVFGSPPPLPSGGAVIEAGRPGIGNRLSHGINIVRNFEARDVCANEAGQTCGSELHGCHVEGIAMREWPARLHDFQRSADRIGHVHHVELCVFSQKTGVAAVFQGVVKDFYRIISGTATGRRHVRD